jgi:cytochrome P450 family 135
MATDVPPTVPLPSLVQTFMFWRWPHAYLEWCWRRHGSRFTIDAVDLPPLVFFSDKADIKAIVTAPADVIHPGAGAAVIAPLVGERSFMLLEEADHLTGRKAIMPALKHNMIAEHAEMVANVVEEEIASWPSDKPFAVHLHLRALTLKVILRTALLGLFVLWVCSINGGSGLV